MAPSTKGTMDLSPKTPVYRVSAESVDPKLKLVPDGWTGGDLFWLNPVSALQAVSKFPATIEVETLDAVLPFTEGKRTGVDARPTVAADPGAVRYTFNVHQNQNQPSAACGAPDVYLLIPTAPATKKVKTVMVGSLIAKGVLYSLMRDAIKVMQTPATQGPMLDSNLLKAKKAWEEWKCPAFRMWMINAAMGDGITNLRTYISFLEVVAPLIVAGEGDDLKQKVQDQLAWAKRARSRMPDDAFFIAARKATRNALQALLNCRNAGRKGDAALQQKCYETGSAVLKMDDKYLAEWPQKRALEAMATKVEAPVPVGTALKVATGEKVEPVEPVKKVEEEKKKDCCNMKAPYTGCNDRTRRLFAFIDGMEKIERLRRYGSPHDCAMRRYEMQLEDDDMILDAARCRLLQEGSSYGRRRRRSTGRKSKKGKKDKKRR